MPVSRIVCSSRKKPHILCRYPLRSYSSTLATQLYTTINSKFCATLNLSLSNTEVASPFALSLVNNDTDFVLCKCVFHFNTVFLMTSVQCFFFAGFLITLIIVLVHTVLKQSIIQATSKSLRLLPQKVACAHLFEIMSSVGVKRCLSG